MKLILCAIIFIVFGLWGCEEVINIDLGKEKPVLVLNCILVEGDDTVRVTVSQTRPTRDTTTWNTFPEAEVQLFKNGALVGQAEWNGKDCFVLPCRVEAEQTYRVVATVPGRGTVSGETTVPAKIKDYKLEIWQYVRDTVWGAPFHVNYHWQDLPDKVNHYWLTIRKSGYSEYDFSTENVDSLGNIFPRDVVRDTLNWDADFHLTTDSNLPDPFNQKKMMNMIEDGYYTYYSYYIRIEGKASGSNFDLSYTSSNPGYFIAIASLINADYNCDSYLKSIIENEQMRLDILEEPWLFRPKDMHSNIEGGTGIVGSYSVVETRLDSPNKPGKWGPGVPYRR